MDRLPLEIWTHVCSFSDIRSLKKIRFVNSTFNPIAARYLFEGLCVTLIPRYLDKLSEVAFHPTLRFYVRTLYFHYKVLDKDFAKYWLWVSEYELPTARIDVPNALNGEEQGAECYTYTPFSQADMDHHRTNFCHLLTSQKDCFNGRMDLAVLSTALAMLPNLRTIESMEKAFCHTVPPILSDLQRDTCLPEPFINPFKSTQPKLARPLASLLSGLGLARKQILTMDLDAIPWTFWEKNGPSGFSHDVQQLTYTAFRHLESMTVQFLLDYNDLMLLLPQLLPLSMTTFVGAAPRLRLLDLSFQVREHYDANKGFWFHSTYWLVRMLPHAGQLFTTLTLPNLTIFRLGSCKLTEQVLLGFIKRHATTLKEIGIDTVILDNRSDEPTSWEKLVKQVAPLLSLDWVMLWSLRSDDIENVVLAGDPDFEARVPRHRAYCEGLKVYLHQGGRTECPSVLDFERPLDIPIVRA